ncbi:MAG: hypothetical protein KC582_01450 [Candidatus Magasanikbacteria bacterium]|nr:hypothetical protein [Candidatus Magasanikbacteria bacterium]MCA9389159.1 hypothetical protein [Candidatus Magasanikbacteria bacterium]MCA9390900.1 hypothetical protein [Candidatus Magasanikbacteria bacterium]
MFTFERLRASLQTQRSKKFFATVIVAVIAIIGVFGTTHGVSAQTQTAPTGVCSDAGIISFVCSGVSFVLGMIAEFLGRLILLVLSVLIAFAQYNGFSTALPVEQGWVIVRDVTNMFFIIVLLLTAFATVIGRDEYHYSKILPGLLLQAVLINFSKTIIQLMIDFSQVVMLTFVNAFAQSAAGNFIYALGLDKMMNLRPNSGVEISSLMIAYMLAIFFMSITLGVVIILTAFLIYRIVFLWITLILAPLAFFVTALPGKFQSSLKAVGSEYWGRLSGLLTGGPVMAFFLWLTLAITQNSSSAATAGAQATGSLAANLNLVRPNSGAGVSSAPGVADSAGALIGSGAESVIDSFFGFITQIADTEHIASFIVGIALLTAALDAALASAAIVGAGTIAALTKSGVGKLSPLALGKGAFNVGRGAGRAAFKGAGYVARGAYNIADERIAASTGNSMSRELGLAGHAVLTSLTKAPLVGGALRRTKAYQNAENKTLDFAGRLEKKGTELEKTDAERARKIKGLARSGAEEKKLLEIAAEGTVTRGSFGSPYTSRKGEAQFAALLGDKDLNEKVFKETKHSLVNNDFIKKFIDQGMDPATAETTAKAASELIVRNNLMQEQANYFEKQKIDAEARGDRTKLESIERLVRASPMLAVKGEAREKALKDLVTSPDAYKDVDSFNANNGEVVTAFMLNNGWTKDEKTGEIELNDIAAWQKKKDEVRDVNKTLFKALESQELFVNNSPGVTVDQLQGMQMRINPADQTMQAFSLVNNKKVSPHMFEGQRIRNTTQVKALERIKSSNLIHGDGMLDAVNSGAPLAEVLHTAYSSDTINPTELIAEAIGDNFEDAGKKFASISNLSSDYNKTKDDIKKKFQDLIDNAVDKREIKKLKSQKVAELDIAKANYEIAENNASAVITDAISAMSPAIRAMQQLNTGGVTADVHTKILADISNKTDLSSMLRQFTVMPNAHQDALKKMLTLMIKQADHFRKVEASGKALTADQAAIISKVDRIRVDLTKKGQRAPSGLKGIIDEANNPTDSVASA